MKFLDDHVANPAYLLVLVTGLTMAWWHYSYTIHWIQAAIVLYVVMLLLDGRQTGAVSPNRPSPHQGGGSMG